MKLHPIFKDYSIWWGAMAILSFVKYLIFGLPIGLGYEKHGIVFAIIGTLFSSLIFGSIPYLIYRLFSRKWNNKVYIVLIVILWFIILVAPSFRKNRAQSDFGNNVEFKNYTSLNILLDDNQYYHSTVNNFRVQIPEQWSLMKGQALGNEFNAVSVDENAMFSLQVAIFKGDEINIDDVPKNFFMEGLKANRVKEMNISFSENTTVANQKAKHYSLTFSYNHLNENIGYVVDSYLFVYKNKVYHLICKERTEYTKTHSTEFDSILQSFMLENYE